MRMSKLPFPTGSLATLIVLCGVGVLMILASPAWGETGQATVPAEPTPVAATVASAVAEVPPAEASSASTEAGSSEPASAPAPEPAAAEAPAPADIQSVQTQVTKVAASVAGGEAAGQVKATAEKATSAATAPLKSVVDKANLQPVVEEVQPAVGEVVGGISSVKGLPDVRRLPDEATPGLPSRPASGDRPAAAPAPVPAEGPAPIAQRPAFAGDEAAPPAFETAAPPLETSPVAGWIDALDRGGASAGSEQAPAQAPGGYLDLAAGSVGVAASQASPGGTPGPRPLHGPGPAPAPSSSAAPGLGGGSFFVPIAALLALLALAAPAISRRTKGALAAPVPSQFVCALERPG